MTEKIQFNRPFMTGKELYYIAEAKIVNTDQGRQFTAHEFVRPLENRVATSAWTARSLEG